MMCPSFGLLYFSQKACIAWFSIPLRQRTGQQNCLLTPWKRIPIQDHHLYCKFHLKVHHFRGRYTLKFRVVESHARVKFRSKILHLHALLWLMCVYIKLWYVSTYNTDTVYICTCILVQTLPSRISFDLPNLISLAQTSTLAVKEPVSIVRVRLEEAMLDNHMPIYPE